MDGGASTVQTGHQQVRDLEGWGDPLPEGWLQGRSKGKHRECRGGCALLSEQPQPAWETQEVGNPEKQLSFSLQKGLTMTLLNTAASSVEATMQQAGGT